MSIFQCVCKKRRTGTTTTPLTCIYTSLNEGQSYYFKHKCFFNHLSREIKNCFKDELAIFCVMHCQVNWRKNECHLKQLTAFNARNIYVSILHEPVPVSWHKSNNGTFFCFVFKNFFLNLFYSFTLCLIFSSLYQHYFCSLRASIFYETTPGLWFLYYCFPTFIFVQLHALKQTCTVSIIDNKKRFIFNIHPIKVLSEFQNH